MDKKQEPAKTLEDELRDAVFKDDGVQVRHLIHNSRVDVDIASGPFSHDTLLMGACKSHKLQGNPKKKRAKTF